jgi:hypothetical protein
MELCLLAGGVTVRLATLALTLAWTHSVQKTRWEEDWQLREGKLVIVESRVQGSGAGMEPGPDARFDGQWWRWRPATPPLSEVVLRRSGATADWNVCIAGACRPMRELLPADADPVTMKPCG